MSHLEDQLTFAIWSATRSEPASIRDMAMASTSHGAVRLGLQPLHDASFQTVMLRSGIRLGLINPHG